jgi:hypothetical protein
MSQIPSDEELRALIPALSGLTGLPIAEDRLGVVVPAYQSLLRDVARMDELTIPVELEPMTGFDLTRGDA